MKDNNFEELEVCLSLREALLAMNIATPTPIQSLVMPVALRGESIVATSQTGSGKTLAYLLPLVQRVGGCEQAMIVAPTRELAQQIAGVCGTLCEAMGLSFALIYGGVEYEPQREALASKPNIIITTPGRFIDLMQQGVVEGLSIRYFVLDEVDQMLDLGFSEAIKELAALRSEDCQNLCFSATLPERVEQILGAIMPKKYERLALSGERLAVERIEQRGYYVSLSMMDHLLIHLLRRDGASHSIVFTRSRKMADRVALLLRDNGFSAEAMHSDRSQSAREYILERFRGGETSVLVATDVIARGIDVDCVDHVYNYGLPQDPEQYIHRIGRTARAGREGSATTLCTPEERELLGATCRLMKANIPMEINHPYYTQEVTKALSPDSKRGKSNKQNRKKSSK